MKAWIAALGLALASPLAAQAPESDPVDYADETRWLCLPDRDDPCSRPLPTAALNPNGYGSIGEVKPAQDPPIDCFYVYPTVSRDSGLISDLAAGPEEQGVATLQLARFATLCRTFAPLYRQATLAAIPRVAAGEDVTPIFDRAYGDVLAAWRHYLEHHNQGRPFVLIGHSQGTIHLTRLLAEEIENEPAAGRLLSALLIGFAVEVPEGEVVGGSFQRTPLCTRLGQTGCVITYMSFRATNPPPPGGMFGRAARPGMTAACTNPAALGGGTAPLDSYWFAAEGGFGASDIAWSSEGTPPVPFLRTEGLVSAACINRGATGYLSVLVNADPADARTDDIPGDVRVGGRILPDWGLHITDMNLAMGDLLRAVEAQRDAYRRRR
ncbi:DUF3089 domain-containing protein [Sphingosinicella terrae]|uniref:DUF3089 domain-containing protein n=1 Tax=Sphingosinicella terrae TaxID=2172047 RepID=UPI000E0DDDEC|nr:DUF3089 domain-containing protein [Sphingosinicella terrae]